MSIEIYIDFFYNYVMSKVILKVQNLSNKYFGGNAGVRVANFEMNEKETLILLGKSFSGKSSLLRCILGLEKYNGEVLLYDDIDKKMSYTFDDRSLIRNNTVFDTLAYPFVIRKETNFDEIIINQAKKYDIEKILYKKIKYISKDEKKIVLLARAMIRQNNLYVIDNPLKDVDYSLRLKIFEIFKNDCKDKSVIYATDKQEEAIAFESRIAIMAYGQLMQIGYEKELLKYPKNRMVLTSLGYNEYKEAKLLKEDNNYYVELDDSKLTVSAPICDIFINNDIILPVINNKVINNIYFDKDTDNVISKVE